MAIGIKDIKIWTGTFLESVQEIADGFLGGATVTAIATKEVMPDPLLGAFLQVVCPEGPVLLGITGTEVTCDRLARLMLGMEPEEALAEADAFDAVGEIMNIVAGAMKTKLADRVGVLDLGLPVFLSGQLHTVGNIAIQSIEVTIGPNVCNLLVFALTGN